MRIVILTGAGISAESGIPTFRAEDGLWSGFNVEDVATPAGYKRNPQLVLDFYNNRRSDVKNAMPNAAHEAIARLQNSGRHDVTLITQNVDDLHERGGSPKVIHMHGSLANALCANCGAFYPANEIMRLDDKCPECDVAKVRPDIVWFGEIPYSMDYIESQIEVADLFIAIGTSGNVYPAAGFARTAKIAKAKTVELNLYATNDTKNFDEQIEGLATVIVPEFVNNLLK
jgi:NAD-dependent deacetylase